MKKLIFYLLVFSASIFKGQGKNAWVYFLRGDTVEAKLTEVLPFEITGFIKGKYKSIKADSLVGFRYEGNEYLALRAPGVDHFEFATKLKNMDEFALYGWREVVDLTSPDGSMAEPVNFYKYIKRHVDDRLRVFEYNRAGLEQIPLVNCPAIMQEMLKKYSSFENLVDLLEAYERDCGIEMRSR